MAEKKYSSTQLTTTQRGRIRYVMSRDKMSTSVTAQRPTLTVYVRVTKSNTGKGI